MAAPRARGRAHGAAPLPRAGRAKAPAAPERRPLYVYCIVRASPSLHLDVAGMDERWPVHTIQHGKLAAVVSDVASAALEPTRANLLAHERVNGLVLRDHTVIPMSFGTIFRSGADVLELLRSAADTFSDVLQKMHGRLEFGLRVFWDRDAVIGRIEAEDEEIRRLHRAIASGQGSGLAERMRYGQLVEAALARQSELCVAEFLRRLQDVCVASRCNPTVGDRMLLNAAFLVQRDGQAAFDQRVEAIAKEFDPFTFRISGPWPPYNFVEIRLKRE